MKKLLRYANLMALLAGGLGVLLLLWLRANGPDQRGLYPQQHPAWTLLLLLTLAIPVIFWLLSRAAGSNNTCHFNFPASPLAAIGYALAGSGMIAAGITTLGGTEPLEILAGISGILGGLLLLGGVYTRLTGRNLPFSIHALPCIFLILELFRMGQTLGAEPEMSRYLFSFLAVLSALPACYWLWSFDVDMGNRTKCLFWCLAAGYCNLVATIGSESWLLHLGIALWMLTALPRLQLPRQMRQAEEVPPEEPLPIPMPVENVVAEVADHTPQMADVDAILDQIMKEYGNTTKE